MRAILSRANRGALELIARTDVLLGFDFDGTLAPITGARERAVMRKTTRKRLAEVARVYPCVVVSGRAQADVARRLEGIRLRAIIGNHGGEPWGASTRVRHSVRRWHTALSRALASQRGVEIEDKAFSLAIHYRRSRNKVAAHAAILSALGSLAGIRVIGGKDVINVLPQGAPDKGMALERERERLGCEAALYVGDDVTDEDVFALEHPERLLAIRVGRKRGSRASYCLLGQTEIDELLLALARLRRRAPSGTPASRRHLRRRS